MSTSDQRRKAGQLYDSGHALFQQGLFSNALAELQHAVDLFQAIDVRGHPFSHPLSNGVSGLANALALSGLCCQKLGKCREAISFYETSFVNEKFENKHAFKRFVQPLQENLIFCYQALVDSVAPADRENLVERVPDIDTAFQFPYSLPPDLIPFARLYELSPLRFQEYEQFYKNACKMDADLRRQSKTTDESTMKRMAVYVWSILVIIWVAYGAIVIESFMGSKR